MIGYIKYRNRMYTILNDVTSEITSDKKILKIHSNVLKDMKILKNDFKKAYRKLSLKHHPDDNNEKFTIGRIEKESKSILNNKLIKFVNSYVYGYESELAFVMIAYDYKILDESIKFSKKEIQLIESLSAVKKFNL